MERVPQQHSIVDLERLDALRAHIKECKIAPEKRICRIRQVKKGLSSQREAFEDYTRVRQSKNVYNHQHAVEEDRQAYKHHKEQEQEKEEASAKLGEKENHSENKKSNEKGKASESARETTQEASNPQIDYTQKETNPAFGTDRYWLEHVRGSREWEERKFEKAAKHLKNIPKNVTAGNRVVTIQSTIKLKSAQVTVCVERATQPTARKMDTSSRRNAYMKVHT